MFNEDFTLKKKHLGWILLTSGTLAFVGIFSLDLINIVQDSGFGSLFSMTTIDQLRSPMGIGPAQRLALLLALGIAIIGISLIPLGDQPA